jgi:hypothetical protein
MHLWTERASTEAWAADLAAAQRDVVAARERIAEARTAAAGLIAATAWASPAMTAFQGELGAWLDRLDRQDDRLVAFDAVLTDAGIRLQAHGWNGLG